MNPFEGLGFTPWDMSREEREARLFNLMDRIPPEPICPVCEDQDWICDLPCPYWTTIGTWSCRRCGYSEPIEFM